MPGELITPENLEARGYRRYDRGWSQDSLFMYQKTIYDGVMKLYFITVDVFDFSAISGMDRKYGMGIRVQFRRPGEDGDYVNVDYLYSHTRTTIDEVESFYANMYRVMGFEPYERDP